MTPKQIEKIAEKWAFKAAEEAENQGGFDAPDEFVPFIKSAITEALTPAWTRELPTEIGEYWWCDPMREAVSRFNVDKNPFGEIVARHLGPVRHLKGWWMKTTTPALPKESEGV